MTNKSESAIYEGGCHCGAVRFRVRVNKPEAINCNCSICRKKGFIHLIVPPEQFTLLKGGNELTTYTFNTGTAKHTFCRICGIHPFYHPRSHPGWFDVNVRTLDEDVLERFDIKDFDGANWEKNIDELRQE
ncbi:GFA family protein [Gloeothece verrucosa]|uniref:Glutathione-dependent formaldehyde-activating GFA n=1 Tax=Gloeothece verrucosa (strain PCC 7822) TaxID=497965 RepID=E0U6Q0_GLOV7|nr:GFA family protein [Gloeothece verrucosa]ADN14809.1 glutathione-dependent formaldehyde-activating GFA [Gloeothece verrucosa PCC 7822]